MRTLCFGSPLRCFKNDDNGNHDDDANGAVMIAMAPAGVADVF